MAGYKKKRAKELKHDRFRDTTLGLFDKLGDKLEGKGQTILYAIGGIILLSILFGVYSWWSGRKTDEARRALGRAIEIAEAPVTPSPLPNTTAISFPTEKDRAEKAVKEFQAVADKYGNPYREIARLFIATNRLTLDRTKAIEELRSLTQSKEAKVSILAKFALAQVREADAQYDEAATLYKELAAESNPFIPTDTVNLRLATVYEKQGKKKEAADILFTMVETARKTKDPEGKPIEQSGAVREAAQKLEKIDAARFEQLPPEPPPMSAMQF